MIDYTLALQLKNAGFTQFNSHWYWDGDTIPETLWCINILEDKNRGNVREYVACPTLSELVEACKPDNGFALVGPNKNIRDVIEDKGYGAVVYQGGILRSWRAFNRNDHDDMFGEGNTPEEAVAAYWLKINQK